MAHSILPGPVSAHTQCPLCRMDVPPHAKKCGHCAEWIVPTQLTSVDQVLVMLGWAWGVLSVLGGAGVFLAAPDGSATTASVPLALGLVLQGIVIGCAIVSYAKRGPRLAAP